MSIADKLTTIAENQHRIYQAGYDKGVSEGSAEDYEKGVEDGKKAEYDAFWDTYQKNGTREMNNYLFYTDRWNDTNYNPKYDILCSSALSLFYSSKISDTKVTVDCVDINAHTVFAYCGSLHTIRKFVVSEDTTYERTFISCIALQNLTIEGTIGKNGFNIQWSTKLTHDSLMSIINALADKSTDTSGTEWTCTIGTDNIAKLTNEEQSIAEEKGWILA